MGTFQSPTLHYHQPSMTYIAGEGQILSRTPLSEILYGWLAGANRVMLCPMVDVLMLLSTALTSLVRSRVRLEAEILVLRQQINVLRPNSSKRSVFRPFDRLVFVGLYRLAPGILDALAIVRPDTVVRWHQAGFRSFWRWKSRRRGGRPTVPLEIRRLIREMSLANPFWGAPHPRRTARARHRCGPDERCKVHGTEEGRAVTGVEDLSFQSR
jgi:hypothetical protein